MSALQAHPHLAASISVDRVDVVGDQAAGIATIVPVTLEASCALVEPHQAAAAPTDPQVTGGVPVDAVDVRSGAERVVALAREVVGDAPCFAIQSVQGAREETHPQHPVWILVDRFHPAGQEAIGI